MLSPSELRRRWTIELTSLRRRQKPGAVQEARIILLQKFLAVLDPLRKLENESMLDKDFKGRLLKEIQMQESINNKDYQDRVYARILVAMIGKPLGQPSDTCRKAESAMLICEDHGESFDVVIERMVAMRLLRKDPKSGGLSLSTLGADLMERIAEKKMAAASPLQNGNATLFDKLDGEARRKVINFAAMSETGAADVSALRETPSVSRPLQSRKIPGITTPKKVPDVAAYLKGAVARNETTTHIIHNLEMMKAITNIVWDISVEKQQYDSPSIWTCHLSMRETGKLVFTATSTNKKSALHKACGLALAKLMSLPGFRMGRNA